MSECVKYPLRAAWVAASGKWCEVIQNETICAGKTRDGETVKRITFKIPAQSGPMNVVAGQGQTVMAMWGGYVGPCRYYTPNVREDGRTFELTLRAYKNGQVSKYLENLEVGQMTKFVWPAPPFMPRRNAGKQVGLIAYGMGITECFQIAAKELSDEKVSEVVLVYSTRTAEEQEIMGPELRSLEEKYGEKRFRLVQLLTREKNDGMMHGRIDEELLKEVFPWERCKEDARFLPVGTANMITDATCKLESIGYKMTIEHNLLLSSD